MEITPPKKWLRSAVIIGSIYFALVVVILGWLLVLQPTRSCTISNNITIDTHNNLAVSGKNLNNLSATLTPSIHNTNGTVSSSFTWGKTQDIAVQGNYAWIVGTSGLLGYDIQQPGNPVLKSSIFLQHTPWRLTTKGNKAFIACGTYGVLALDISNPGAPKQIFHKYKNTTILDVATNGNLTVLATARSGLIFLDTTILDKPRQICTLPVAGNLQALTIENKRLYAVGKNKKHGILHIIDIKNELLPKATATIQLPHPAWSCAIFDTKLLIALGKWGVYSINISVPDKTNVEVKSTINKSAYALQVKGDTIFVANMSNRIYGYKYNGGILHHCYTMLLPGRCRSIANYGDLIVATTGRKGFVIIAPGMSGGSKKVALPLKNIDVQRNILTATDNTICLLSTSILHLLAWNTADELKEYDSINFFHNIRHIVVDGNYAFVTLNNNELYVVNTDQREQQRVKYMFKFQRTIRALAAADNHLYVSQSRSDIIDINVNDAIEAETTLHPTTTAAKSPACMAIKDKYLYTATEPNSFKIYQLHDLDPMTLSGSLRYPLPVQMSLRSNAIAICGNYALVSKGFQGIFSIDISDKSHPRLCSSVAVDGFCGKLVVYDKLAYVTVDNQSVKVIDVSDPAQMKVLCDLPGTVSALASRGKLLEAQDNGVAIMDPLQPLKRVKHSSIFYSFKLPRTIASGYYDLQLACTTELKEHRNLLHFSAQNGWEMTRPTTEQ